MLVVGGDITELQVDVLVNAANTELKHAGGLAAVIVNKGKHQNLLFLFHFIRRE